MAVAPATRTSSGSRTSSASSAGTSLRVCGTPRPTCSVTRAARWSAPPSSPSGRCVAGRATGDRRARPGTERERR
jgi:hypothetical protein